MSCSLTSTIYEDLETICSGLLGLVSIFLYFYHIQLILRKSAFHHPFFYQFILLSISNIILWISIYITQRIVGHPYLCGFLYPVHAHDSWLMKPLLIGYFIPLTVQTFTIIVLSINRMTVVMSPFSAPKFWQRYSGRTIILTIVSSCIYSFYVWNWKPVIVLTLNGRLSLTFVDGWPHIPLVLMAGIISIICLVVIIVTTAVTLSKICKYSAHTAKAEISMFWSSVGFSMTTAVVVCYTLTLFISFYIHHDFYISKNVVMMKGYVYDVNCLAPAWLIIFTNKQVKNSILRRKKPTHVHVSIFSHYLPSKVINI